MRLLLAAGAAVNLSNAAGWTPLMLCLLSTSSPANRRQRCTRLLLEAGADVAVAAQGGWSAALVAANRGDHVALATLLSYVAAQLRCRTPQQLIEARTAAGDAALHLACHAGSDRCVRLLLAAGADANARNTQGLDAAALAIIAACAEGGDLTSDAATGRFESILGRLGRATCLRESGDGGLLHRVAAAPSTVPLRRILGLAATLRRCGCDDAPAAGQPELPSVVATRFGRPALAALLRAPRPAPSCLVCLRRPVESESPKRILLHEGALVQRPELRAETDMMRMDVLRAMRSGEESHRASTVPQGRNGSTDAQVAEAAEAAAEEGAATFVGGARERWRSFSLVADLPCTLSTDDDPIVSAASLSKLRVLADGTSVREREELPVAIARCLADAAAEEDEGVEGQALQASPMSEVVPQAVRRLPAYRQRRRWLEVGVQVPDGSSGHGAPALHPGTGASNASSNGHDASNGQAATGQAATGQASAQAAVVSAKVDVVELTPQRGAPLLHDAHLELLLELIGPNALEDESSSGGDALRDRPWSFYTETLDGLSTLANAHSGGGDEGLEMGLANWNATAEVFSLDAPLLLAFAAEHGAQVSLAAALGRDEDEDEDLEGDEDLEPDAEDVHNANAGCAAMNLG